MKLLITERIACALESIADTMARERGASANLSKDFAALMAMAKQTADRLDRIERLRLGQAVASPEAQ